MASPAELYDVVAQQVANTQLKNQTSAMSVPMVPRPLALGQGPSQIPSIPDDLDEIWIAVMGVTGAGKSRFISACTGLDVRIGHTLESCTTEVDDFSFVWRDKHVHLIDTPGFDDTHKSDREVLEGIASWMSTAYSQDIKLSGVLYLHRVTDVRVGGTSLRNLTMFKKLCGDQFYPRVFLVTTMWDKIAKSEGEKREHELISKSDFWGAMIKGGAQFERHYGTRDSAMDILREVIRNSKVDAPKVLKVQHQMVDDGLRLDQTDAGRQFEAELLKQREKHEREMKQMQEDVKMLLDMNEKKAAAETEKQRRLFEERIKQSFEDQAKLKSSLEEIQRRQAEDLAKMQERIAQEQTAYEEKIRNLERQQSDLNHMDPTSQAARDMQSQIQEGEADAARMAQNLANEDKRFQKKVKRVFIRGWEKSRDAIRNNPNVARFVVRSGASLLVKLVEWEMMSQITGVDLSSFSPLFSGLASWGADLASAGLGGGDGGGADGGGEDVGNDGDVGNPDETGGPPAADPNGYSSDPVYGTTDPSAASTDGGYTSPIIPLQPTYSVTNPDISTSPDVQDFPPTSFVDSTEPPPIYSTATDFYAQMASYSAVAQQSMDSAIAASQQFIADQTQQVSNATAISGIAAGNDVYEVPSNTPAVDSLSSQMNQMNMASMQWQPLQDAASMPAI